MFSKLSKREKYILYISIIIVASVFIDRVMISPVMRVLNNLSEEISVHEKKLERSMRIWNEGDSIRSEYERNMLSLKKILSDEEEIAGLSSEIEKLGRKTAVLIKNIKPLPIEEGTLYTQYKINIEAEAEMPFLMDFIYQLEKSPQLLKVNRFSLTPKNKQSAALKVNLLVTKVLIPDDSNL